MLTKFAQLTQKFVHDNSPTILAAMGVVGTVTTAVLSSRAGYRAAEIISANERVVSTNHPPRYHKLNTTGGELDPREKFNLTWELYIPPVLVGVASCGLILGSVYVGNRRIAALAAAYSLSEKAISEYKEKVIDQIGKNKERKIRDAVVEDRIRNDSIGSHQIAVTGGGESLCYDMYTGRYFFSSMETLRQAQNQINHVIINSYYASLTDFYDQIGLPKTGFSDEVGWNADELLELRFTTTMSDDDRPCIAVEFKVSPIRNYHRIN